MVRKMKQREKRRQQLLQVHEVDVLLEKCWLLDLKPEENPEYKNALKQIEAELGPPPVLKTMETLATLAKLHRQGASNSYVPLLLVYETLFICVMLLCYWIQACGCKTN